jgi:hypothetical protein
MLWSEFRAKLRTGRCAGRGVPSQICYAWFRAWVVTVALLTEFHVGLLGAGSADLSGKIAVRWCQTERGPSGSH